MIVGVVCLGAALSWIDHQGWLLSPQDGARALHRQWIEVARVIDGDTIDLDRRDGEHDTTRIRLWGIDTPEVGRDGRPGDPFADAAEQRTRQLVAGQRVRVLLEPHDLRDRFGRVLAYLELPDGSILNERLLVEGLAEADDRFHHGDLKRYELLEQQARHDRLGIWSEAAHGQPRR